MNIKFLSQHPCPRCLVQKADVPKMETKSDMTHREAATCVDDEAHRQKIKKVWKLIFWKGAGIEGKHIKDILNPQSLIPTRVSVSPT